VPTVAALVRTHALDVTFTRFVAPAQPRGAWRAYYARWAFALQPPDAPLWEVVPELRPTTVTDPATTVDAPTFSKWGPELASRVGETTLLLAGVSTDCCVLSTAVAAAADAGVPVQVVADACAGVDDASHRTALELMALYAPLIEVVVSADVLP
jgi:nicotinamidase-related amidase